MSRTSLHRPRRNRAVWHRTASGTRLFTCPFPPTVPLHISHYKRCPRAHRLRLRSDQSLSPPVHVTGYGRFPDKKRHALSKGPCQVRAALTRRTTLALSGDAHEHGVKLLARAIVPRDSTVVALGEAMPHSDGRESTPPYLRMAGHFWWSRLPHTEIPSRLLPRPLRSTGLSQSRRRCGTSAVADNTHRYRRRRLPAQPSGTFHPLPLQFRHSRPFTPSFRPPSRNPSPFAAQPGLSQVRLREA